MQIFCGYLWEKGTREKNEDSLAFWQISKGKHQKVMAVICDGIGGLDRGEQASSYVVRQMANWFMSQGYQQNRKHQVNMLQQFFFQVDEELKTFGQENGVCLGTTVTMVLVDGYQLSWYHCGDCRLYLFRGKRVKKITREHQDEKGNLKRAIGVGKWEALDCGRLRIRKKDRIFLCSDGIYRNVGLDELQIWGKRNIENDEQAKRMLKQLFHKKVSRGEQDNMSAIYFGYVKG